MAGPPVADLLRGMRAYIGVEAAQEQRAAIQLGDPRAQSVENTGKFHRNVAAPDHDQSLREPGQVKDLVGRGRQVAAGEGRYVGPAAGGDENAFSRIVLSVDCHRVCIDDPGAPAEQIVVNGIEAGDLVFLVITQRGPVERRHGGLPAKALCVDKALAVLGGIDVEFFRHAAHVDAGATHIAVFGYRDPRTETRCHPGGANAARACADYKQVEVLVAHVASVVNPIPNLSSVADTTQREPRYLRHCLVLSPPVARVLRRAPGASGVACE